MSFTGINSPTGGDGTHVTLDTPTNTLLPPHALPDSRVIPSALGVWGVSSIGIGYVDPLGASQGEQAAIGYDAMGSETGGVPCFFLENVTDPAIRFSMDLRRPGPPLEFSTNPPPLVSRHATPPLDNPESPGPLLSVHAMPPLEYQEVT